MGEYFYLCILKYEKEVIKLLIVAYRLSAHIDSMDKTKSAFLWGLTSSVI